MKVVFLGPPGAGKGTQAKKLSEKCGIPHHSTGDIFRDILKESSPLSRELAGYVNEGELVPDEIVFKTVKKTLDSNRDGWVLDGYPRNRNQAKMLDNFLNGRDENLTDAVYLEVPREVIINRLSNRRVCSECGEIYNLSQNPPENEGVCDKCGGELVQREDDKPKTVRKRLKIFSSKIKPLKEYYREKGVLEKINGDGDVGEVFERIKEELNIG